MSEARLEGHDIVVSIGTTRSYRLSLLASSDLCDKDSLNNKLQRLSLLQGGQDVGIAFLLGKRGDFTEMMELQDMSVTRISHLLGW